MSVQDLLAIVLALSLSGIWLMYKLNQFQWMPKIKDSKGIVIPSFVFLLSPFLAIWIMPTFIRGDLDEIIKSVLPLVTFILGQAITKREKQKEEKQQKIDLATMIILNLETKVIGALSRIEGRLMESIRNPDKNEIAGEIECLLREFELEMEKLYEKLSFQLDVTSISSGIGTLLCIEKSKMM